MTGMTGMAGMAGVDDASEPSEASQLRPCTDRHGLGECVAVLGPLRGDAPARPCGRAGAL